MNIPTEEDIATILKKSRMVPTPLILIELLIQYMEEIASGKIPEGGAISMNLYNNKVDASKGLLNIHITSDEEFNFSCIANLDELVSMQDTLSGILGELGDTTVYEKDDLIKDKTLH